MDETIWSTDDDVPAMARAAVKALLDREDEEHHTSWLMMVRMALLAMTLADERPVDEVRRRLKDMATAAGAGAVMRRASWSDIVDAITRGDALNADLGARIGGLMMPSIQALDALVGACYDLDVKGAT